MPVQRISEEVELDALVINDALVRSFQNIGGFDIGVDYIRDVANSFGFSAVVTGGDDVRLWAGDSFANRATAPFRLTEAGVMTATVGTIGGCTFNTNYLSSSTFVSGPLGSGWRIMSTGSTELQDATIRGIIRTSVFEKDTISAVNGLMLISSSDVLSADMTALDSSTLVITGETTFSANEVIRIKDGTNDEWLLVTNAASAPTYTVTRDLAGSYAPNTNPIWKKGTAVVSTGVGTGTTTGYILLDSSSTNSPYIDIYKRNSNTYTDTTLKARLGWLKGIVDADVGLSSTDVWGLYSDSVYLKGAIVATTGYIGGTTGWVITSNNIKDAAGVVGLSSTVTGGDDIRFWAGHATPASAPFYVTESGALVATSATISGTITATSGTIGGFDVGSDYIRDAANSFGLASTVTGGNDIRFWAGDTFSNRATAPLRIFENGSIIIGSSGSASNAIGLSITKDITASAGSGYAVFCSSAITASGNGDGLYYSIGIPSFQKGALTGLRAFGYYVLLNAASGSGTIDNAYGLYINTVSVGTNNWGVYVVSAASYFGGVTTFNAGLDATSIGSTTPGTGAFTTLSASSTVSGTGFSTYLASPPAIGSGTPGTGAFTTLSASGLLSTAAGYQFRAANNTPYELLRYVGGTNNPGLVARVVESTGEVSLDATGASGSWFLAIKNAGSEVGRFSSTGLAVTGTISTTDPAGGAGPAWKLGVAASVSPTSPNRTLRVDIGGTSYYIAAKTTND